MTVTPLPFLGITRSRFPAPGAIPYFRQHQLPEGGNEFTLAPEGFHESFCADLPADDAAFYAISQRPGQHGREVRSRA
jgi:hypothetical protein